MTLDSVGRYECRAATTGFPEISRQLMVFARGRPEVGARSPQRGVAGGTVTVECVVTSVPPPSATVWYLYGRPIRTGETVGRWALRVPACAAVGIKLALLTTWPSSGGLWARVFSFCFK